MTEKLKLVFGNGAFDGFEGTQEELDEIVADIEKMFADGTFMDNAQLLDPEEETKFVEAMEKMISSTRQ